MEMRTKFNVGDHIIGISSKHLLVAFEIARIAVFANADSVEVDYYPPLPSDGYGYTSFPEKYCFATKDEALAYIQGK